MVILLRNEGHSQLDQGYYIVVFLVRKKGEKDGPELVAADVKLRQPRGVRAARCSIFRAGELEGAGLRASVSSGFQARFPPAVAHGLLLGSLTAAIE